MLRLARRGEGEEEYVCVFVCRCVSGFCLCYWSSFWKVKHPGKAATVTVEDVCETYLFLDVCKAVFCFISRPPLIICLQQHNIQ